MRKGILKFFLVSVSLISVFNLNAQGGSCTQLDVISDESITITILSQNEPYVNDAPDFGDISLEETAPFTYDLTYTPDPGFGSDNGAQDNFNLVIWPLDGGIILFPEYCVTVSPAIVRAEHDIALTVADLPVFIDVVNNDFSTLGYFDLESVSVTNNGTAEIVGNNILFTPEPGFVGLTDFDYVICVLGNCDVGTVSINVLGDDLSFPTDTVSLFAKKAGEAFLFVPEDYSLLVPPQHGAYDDSQEVPRYIANGQFIGEDYLTFENELGEVVIFEVTLLDLVDNLFAVEDQYNTIANSELVLRPLYNDGYGNLAGCVNFGTPIYGSLVPTGNPSQMIYQPPADWTGIDRLEYTSSPPGCEGESETETIYILVSNFEPEAEEVSLTISAGGQVPITYDIPVDANAEWSVVSTPTLGSVSAVDGQLVYTAPEQAGNDQLSINYCLTDGDDPNCIVSKTVVVNLSINTANGPVCNEDCVWPGDANADGVVDLGDMLPIGRYMGTYGTAREEGDPLVWCPQNSSDWGESAANGADLKHADTDGNRFIDNRDTSLVRQNLGLAHQIRPSLPMLDAFDVNLVGDIFAEPGEIIALDIVIAGEIQGYVGTEDIYGFRLPFQYDPEFIDPTTISVEFDAQAWTSYDSPIISMSNGIEGLFETAYSRTNGLPASGFGKVGTMYVGTEDIYGFRPGDEPITVTIGGGKATAMTGAGYLGSVNIQPFELTILPRPEADEDLSQEEIQAELIDDLLTYPNPAGDNVNIHLNGGRYFNEILLTDLHGRVVSIHEGLETNHFVLNLSNVSNGMYSLRVTTEEGVVTRKLEVLR
ncbi:MAG: Ig-like domain-containing protein [Bacteroidota bacterium]